MARVDAVHLAKASGSFWKPQGYGDDVAGLGVYG